MQRITLIVMLLVLVTILIAACGATATAPAAPADEAVVYITKARTYTENIGKLLQKVADLMQNPSLSDADWNRRLGATFADIRLTHQQLKELVPPVRLQAFHTMLTDATQKCSDATVLAALGIDAYDTDAMVQSAALLRECADGVRQATELK